MKTYPIAERENKVSINNFGKVEQIKNTLHLVTRFPYIGTANDFRDIIYAIGDAREKQKPVIAMMGAHVIKCGCSPYIIELMRKGVITAIAMNGAAAIHDFEIGMIGATSEPVEKYLPDGKFGMWEETGSQMNACLAEGKRAAVAYGEYLYSSGSGAENVEYSILAQALNLGVVATVHHLFGAEIIHQHNNSSGFHTGRANYWAFTVLKNTLPKLNDGGVLLNFGSAVIMPEIFLKALNLARNEGNEVKDFVTANFDMIAQYRAIKNVVERPHIGNNGRGYNIIGMHEIMIPLLTYAVLDKMEEES